MAVGNESVELLFAQLIGRVGKVEEALLLILGAMGTYSARLTAIEGSIGEVLEAVEEPGTTTETDLKLIEVMERLADVISG